jgi:protein-S-isoprenylcysteine O-methyltransferase Ste14
MIIEMISKAIFLDVLAVYVFSLYVLTKGQPKEMKTRKLYLSKGDLFLDTLTNIAWIIPMVYIFTPWLDFADYQLSLWFSLVGVLLFIVALWLLGKAHSMIGHNFSPRMEIGDEQTPVSQGVYHYFRHPIFAGFWLWSIAQPLLLHNWIAGFAMLVTFLPLYFVWVAREEKLSLGRFGEAHRKYMEQTGRIFPFIKHKLQRSGIGEREKARDS